MGLKIAGVAASMGNPQLKNEVQALLWLKGFLQIIKWPPSRMQIVNGSFKYIKEGYQELWTRVAKQHKVLLNTNIQTIIRKEDHIEIHTTDNKFIFDKLIVTCSLTQDSNFLEMTEIEINIFTKVKYDNAWRVIFLTKNLMTNFFFLNI